MIRLCGAALGFLAFAVTIFLGIAAGNGAEVTVHRAIGAMVVFCAIGICTGWVANRILDEHAVAKNREMFPEEPEEEGGGAAPSDGGTGEAAAS